MAIAKSHGCAVVLPIALGFMFDASVCSAQSDQLRKSKPLTQREAVGLNPQPEPPSRKRLRLKPGEMRGLNPQPEPPSKSKMRQKLKPAEMRGLNPQPEPPKPPPFR